MAVNDPPSWVQDAIFYQIFPDRFARAGTGSSVRLEPWDAPPTRHGVKGGDLDGIRAHLDHLSALHVNAIYLTPIFSSPSNHRYHTHDYHAVDPLLGGQRGFDDLMAACRARGIRVVLDAVFNHSGRSFLPFADLLQNGASSPYVDWFEVEQYPLNAYGDGPPGYACWLGIRDLPKLRTDHPPVREYLYGVAERWARAGISGWRFDAPTQIETPGFFEALRARLRAIDPDFYLVGEIWPDARDWAGPGRAFDGVTSYWIGGATLVYASGGRFDFALMANHEYPAFRAPLDATGYAEALDMILGAYPEETARAHVQVFASHDTPRAKTLAGDATGVRLAWLLTFALPGAPCIYYGDEIGLEGGHDPGPRAGFPWDHPERWDAAMLADLRALTALRTSSSALRRGGYRRVASDARVLAFEREHRGERVLVAVNATDHEATIELPGGPWPAVAPSFGDAELVVADGVARVRVPARAGGIFLVSEPTAQ